MPAGNYYEVYQFFENEGNRPKLRMPWASTCPVNGKCRGRYCTERAGKA